MWLEMIDEKSTEIESVTAPDLELVEALPECTMRLGRCIDDRDWEGASKQIALRERLLEELPSTLHRLDKDSPEEKSLAGRRRIRWMLEDLQSANKQLLDKLSHRLSSLREKVKDIRKGRRTLGLYKLPHHVQPRFLNRLG